MVVHVDTVPASAVRLAEADDFKALKVIVAGDGDLGSALGDVGIVDGDHVVLAVDALERLAGPRARTPEWQRGFAAMIDYARNHGWVDDATGTVRAHVERSG